MRPEFILRGVISIMTMVKLAQLLRKSFLMTSCRVVHGSFLSKLVHVVQK